MSPESTLLCSQSLSTFLQRHVEVFDFFFFGVFLAKRIDDGRLVATRALAVNGAEEDARRLADVEAGKDLMSRKLAGFARFQSEGMCIRLVDNFLCFLSGILQSCLRTKPEMLSSKEMISLEDALRFESRNALIEHLIEKKLNELAYGGVKQIGAYLRERTGVRLTDNDTEDALLTVGIELRNIYSHNRGVVNDVFLRRVRNVSVGFEFAPGQRYHASFDDVARLANNAFSIAVRLDAQLSSKFALPTKSLASWTDKTREVPQSNSQSNSP